MKLPSLTVFYPAYNEAENIKDTVQKTIEILPEIAEHYEVLIINDGSKDSTGEIIDQLAKENTHIKALHHSTNKGYGGALKTGMYNAQYAVVVFTDSDGQFDFNEVKNFIPHLASHDLVIGYRTSRAEGFRRHLNAKAWGILMRTVFGINARDIDCAFKMFHKRVLEKIPKLESDGALISAEFLMKASRAGLTIKEVPVTHLPRKAGKPTGANLKVILKAFHELFMLKQKLDKDKVA